MKLPRLAAGALLLTVLASLLLPPASPPPGVRAALHVHTRLSDGLLSPMEVVEVARRRGVQVVAVTEHNTVVAATIAAAYARWTDGPVVLVGEEITTRDYHLLAYGLSSTVRPRRDLGRVLEEVHAQGGVAVAAHPAKKYWPAFEPHVAALDGAEVVHPMAFVTRATSFRWSDMVAFHARHPHLAAIGTSDYHAFGGFDDLVTWLDVEAWPEEREARRQLALAALREGRTATRAPDGRAFGPAPDTPPPARSLWGRLLGALSLLVGLVSFAVRRE